MIGRLLCRLGFHRFGGWAVAGWCAPGPLPFALCARCKKVL